MVRNYYLSRTEQELISILKSADIVTVEEIKELFPELSEDMVRKVLSSLARRGYRYATERLYSKGVRGYG